MKLIITLLTFSAFLSCSHSETPRRIKVLPGDLGDAVSSNARAPENVSRDEYQHPVETLNFFGIKPEMTVAEISPGAGYYAEILAPYLAKHGQYVIVIPRMPSRPPAFMVENERKLQDILLRHQDVQAKAKLVPFEALNDRNRTKPAFADMVVTFNSVHNWVASNSVPMSFKFFWDILKPGGVLGIVQHRGPQGKKPLAKSGYMTEAEVIFMAKKAGFRFVGKSEINANPKDLANYPKGVWTLPPVYRLGELDHDKYEDIGESDRMTLKFVK
jgi:predicted methyltransferase